MRTIHTECLEHLLILSRRHLEATVNECLRHYNQARPHRSLDLAQAIPRPAQSASSTINRRDLLRGIIHEYDIAA
ncbi:MAG: integrase core domain-containing protein [Acidimicrobiales bacterium]